MLEKEKKFFLSQSWENIPYNSRYVWAKIAYSMYFSKESIFTSFDRENLSEIPIN